MRNKRQRAVHINNDKPLPTEDALFVVRIRQVFWLNVILASAFPVNSSGLKRFVSITAAGAAEEFNLLP